MSGRAAQNGGAYCRGTDDSCRGCRTVSECRLISILMGKDWKSKGYDASDRFCIFFQSPFGYSAKLW